MIKELRVAARRDPDGIVCVHAYGKCPRAILDEIVDELGGYCVMENPLTYTNRVKTEVALKTYLSVLIAHGWKIAGKSETDIILNRSDT